MSSNHLSHDFAMDSPTDIIFHSPEAIKSDVDHLLQDFYRDKVVEASKIDPAYGQLWQSIMNLASAGGKRLRPYLVVLAYEMYGGKAYETALPVAAAQELLHLSLLIHDDIADKDTVRYGVDNISGQYITLYGKKCNNQAIVHHAATSAALLAGDLLLAAAHSMVMGSGLPSDVKAVVHTLLNQAVFEVAAGQLLDIEAGMEVMTATDTTKIASLKTASYSFVGPLLAGLTMARGPKPSADRLRSETAWQEEAEKMMRLGQSLGQAFQLADDILGVFGDPFVTGKSNMTDLQEGKHTYLMQLTYQRATPDQIAIIDKSIGSGEITEKEADTIREIIKACGAWDEAQAKLEEFRRSADIQVSALAVSDTAKDKLRQLITSVTKRNH